METKRNRNAYMREYAKRPESRRKRAVYMRMYMRKRKLEPGYKEQLRKRCQDSLKRKLLSDPEFAKAYHERIKRNRDIRRVRMREIIAEFRSGGCKVCGEMCSFCLDAHHMDPKSKNFDISNAQRYMSLESLKKEIGKCVCLCRNCHAKVHAGLLVIEKMCSGITRFSGAGAMK